METFRQEIIEAQKVRSDLLKQKLILNAVLGGVGLGLTKIGASRGLKAVTELEKLVEQSSSTIDAREIEKIQSSLHSIKSLFDGHTYLILCLIPLVCFYIDLLCNHQDLKMLLIGRFLKDKRRTIKQNKVTVENYQNSNKNNINPQEYLLYEKICSEERDAFSLEYHNIILVILVAALLSIFTLAPGLDDSFSEYLDKIYKFKSFLPKELGKIEEQFIAKFSKEPANKNDQIEFSSSSNNSYNPQNKQDNICLLLIKCSQGIVLINPESHYIDRNNVTVKVDNSQNQDNLRSGNYWELGYEFSIKITRSHSIGSYTYYKFQDWEKLDNDGNQNNSGIDIGEKTALFFIYAD